MQTQRPPVSQYASLCAQAGELQFERSLAYTQVQQLDQRIQALMQEIAKLKAREQIEQSALARRDAEADQAGA